MYAHDAVWALGRGLARRLPFASHKSSRVSSFRRATATLEAGRVLLEGQKKLAAQLNDLQERPLPSGVNDLSRPEVQLLGGWLLQKARSASCV